VGAYASKLHFGAATQYIIKVYIDGTTTPPNRQGEGLKAGDTHDNCINISRATYTRTPVPLGK
jgi:hypothetical protein